MLNAGYIMTHTIRARNHRIEHRTIESILNHVKKLQDLKKLPTVSHRKRAVQ